MTLEEKVRLEERQKPTALTLPFPFSLFSLFLFDHVLGLLGLVVAIHYGPECKPIEMYVLETVSLVE